MRYNIEIYTKKNCPYCNRAKVLLKSKNLIFKEISVDEDSDVLGVLSLEMRNRSGGRVTVPQIFINGQHIGGSDDLCCLNNNKKLDYLLQVK